MQASNALEDEEGNKKEKKILEPKEILNVFAFHFVKRIVKNVCVFVFVYTQKRMHRSN